MSSLNKSQDPPEPSKQFRPWKRQLQLSNQTIKTRSTKFQNMPLETNTGNTHQVFTLCPSRIYSNTTSKTTTTKTGSLETKWRRSSNKIRSWQTKFPRPIKHCHRNSRRTPSWPWSQRRWPHTCLSSTTTVLKNPPTQKISPSGENPFSRRRSEDDNKSKSKDSERESKSESESENKDTERKSESKDIMTIMPDSKTKETKRFQHNATAKADKVEAIKRTKYEIRIKPERQLDKFRKYLTLTKQILQVSSHLHLAAAFAISLLIFNYLLSDHFDHLFRTFTFNNFRACEMHCFLRMKASHWAKTAATQLAIPESTRSPRNPETRPDLLNKDICRNTLIPVTLQLISRTRSSENNTQIDSFIFTYLGTPR
jgi:hypothetical protein